MHTFFVTKLLLWSCSMVSWGDLNAHSPYINLYHDDSDIDVGSE